MLRFTETVIRDAFEARQRAYPGWSIDAYVGVWRLASSAFDKGSPSQDDFDALYGELKGNWQVFRNLRAGTAMSEGEVWRMLSSVPQKASRLRLSELKDGHGVLLDEVVAKAKAIKKGKNGAASLMAMTKFLHFWNPRLFIIVDRWAMANNALRRLWLRQSLPGGFSADPDHYVGLLHWASGILRGNPAILREFHRHIRSLVDPKSLPADWEAYEATAVEWFLEGVVELPPHGVSQVE